MNTTERIRPVPLPGERLALTLAHAALRRLIRNLHAAADTQRRAGKRSRQLRDAAEHVGGMMQDMRETLDDFDPHC